MTDFLAWIGSVQRGGGRVNSQPGHNRVSVSQESGKPGRLLAYFVRRSELTFKVMTTPSSAQE